MPKESDPLVATEAGQQSSHNQIPSVLAMIRQGRVVLTNEGSTARDHLANERTYLAWIRTALAITGVGIGLLKWQGIVNTAGYLVVSLGILVLISATVRYLSVMKQLTEGRFEPNVRGALTVVGLILCVVFVLLVLHGMHKL